MKSNLWKNLVKKKKKKDQVLPATIEKIIFSLQENGLMFCQSLIFVEVTTSLSRQGITMGTCKTRAIEASLDIFTHIVAYSRILRHNQAYSGVIQAHLGPCINLALWEPEAYS